MTPDSDARAVLRRYGGIQAGLVALCSLENAGGWSGSRLWRLRTRDEREWCLRQWPSARRDPQRLHFIHTVLQAVSSAGLSVVPVPLATDSGETLVLAGGHFWELTLWMPGRADYREHPTRGRLRAAMQALARFHLLAAQCPPVPGIWEDRTRHRAAAPALTNRLAALGNLEQTMANVNQAEVRGDLAQRAARILPLLPILAARFLPPLAEAANRQLILQPAIRDIWHDHVLFTGEAVSGIVDFGAMDVDTPLTDLARLVGSLAADDCSARSFALDAYAEVRALDRRDRALIDLLDYSGQAVAAIHWLTWLLVERREMGPLGPILRRLDEIHARLAAITSQSALPQL